MLLKINISKSLLVGVGYVEEEIQPFSSKLHYEVDILTLIYLGLPIGASRNQK